METIIRKKVSINQMKELFNLTDDINIRFYKSVKDIIDEEDVDLEEKIFFNIKVRHCENENADKIFERSIKKLKIIH